MTKWTDDKRVTIAYKDNWDIEVAIIHEEIAMPASLVAVEIFRDEQEALNFIHAELLKWSKDHELGYELPEFRSLSFIHTVEPEHREYAFIMAVDEKTLATKRTPDEQGHYWKWGEWYRETWLAPTTEALGYTVEEQKVLKTHEEKYENSPENIAGLERKAESLG